MKETKEFIEEKIDNKTVDNFPKKQKNNKFDGFKTKECKVISYNEKTLELIFTFKGVNIRFTGIKNFSGNTVSVKYKGEIGKPNFEIKL